jgi:hypothetical protein
VAEEETNGGTPGKAKRDIEHLKLAVEVWKKSVEVQQHFNDISLRLRNIAIPLLIGVVGAAGFALKEHQWPLAFAVLMMGGIGWRAFYIMDRFWYHEFLRAATSHVGKIEEGLKGEIPEMGLSNEIQKMSSAVQIPRYIGRGARPMGSRERLDHFYILGFTVLAMAFGVVTGAAISTWLGRPPTQSAPLLARPTMLPVGFLPSAPGTHGRITYATRAPIRPPR